MAITAENDSVKGTVQSGFESVRSAFEANLRSGTELGGHFAVYRNGQPVVDLWGGRMARDLSQPIERTSLYTIFSATKGIVATCVAMLVDRKQLHYDELVSTYWPEFAENGKATFTVGQLMSHQVGLAATYTPATMEDYYNHDIVASALAEQQPDFSPGVWAYHAQNFGVLVDELIRRTDGRTFRQFFCDELQSKADGDLLIGLSADDDHRHVGIEKSPTPSEVAFDSPMPEMYRRSMSNPVVDLDWPNWRRFREAGIPSAGGSANARGLAKIYAALVSETEPLLSKDVMADATCERIAGIDQGSGGIGRYAAGFRMNVGDMGANPAAFGHPGLGGTTGFADPDRRLGIAYTSCRAFWPDWQRSDSRLSKLLVAFYAADAAIRSSTSGRY